jgi:GMP synthase-like glutamine amidotransferase
MLALAIVHQRDAGPGVFSDAARAQGVALDTWLRAEKQTPPRPIGAYDAVLTFGGAMHVDQEHAHPWLRDEKRLLAELVQRRLPLLGVCLGAQLVAEAAGGRVGPSREAEIGWYRVALSPEGAKDPLLAPLRPGFEAFQWHSYEFSLPPGATALARSASCLQAYRADRAWGIQFHAEVTAADAELE